MPDQVFDKEYVAKLREENAKWRNKYRELEAQNGKSAVETELTKRGIQANADWVTVEEGQSVGDAVDALVASYPSLQTHVTSGDDFDLTPDEPKQKMTPKVIAPSTQQSTQPKPVRNGRITDRNIAEIRKDPKARSKVRDLYRDLLQQGSNQTGE